MTDTPTSTPTDAQSPVGPPKALNFDPMQFLDDDALDSLQYLNDQTPEEVAEQYKRQGNDAFQKGKQYYKAAFSYYSKAIRQGTSVPAQKRSVYFSNRAAVELELENFGRCIEDCLEAIKLDPKNMKAYYRANKASVKLGKTEQAVKFIDDALKEDPQNKAMLEEKKKVDEAHLDKRREDLDKEVDQFGNNRQKKAIWNVLGKRGVTLGSDLFENLSLLTRASKIFLDKKDILHWPVFLLYEEHKQLDLISDFAEDTTFEDHLEVIFPGGNQWTEWDKDHLYDYKRVEVYAILHHVEPYDKKKRTGKMPIKTKLDMKSTLKDILTRPEYVVPGIPVFFVITPEYKKSFLSLPFDTLKDGY